MRTEIITVLCLLVLIYTVYWTLESFDKVRRRVYTTLSYPVPSKPIQPGVAAADSPTPLVTSPTPPIAVPIVPDSMPVQQSTPTGVQPIAPEHIKVCKLDVIQKLFENKIIEDNCINYYNFLKNKCELIPPNEKDYNNQIQACIKLNFSVLVLLNDMQLNELLNSYLKEDRNSFENKLLTYKRQLKEKLPSDYKKYVTENFTLKIFLGLAYIYFWEEYKSDIIDKHLYDFKNEQEMNIAIAIFKHILDEEIKKTQK